ncbi:MAG TPA: sulfite exporter TauE/SafE family protein [Rhodocyclaceae bacterium]|nr:sulfite exporter TauE/SafE family protein [Rhodocyclaceae bacterium]
MPDSGFLAMFLVGLLGAPHCAGMCGGIVAALAVQSPGGRPSLAVHLAYNAGRIASYTAAGLLAGLLGGVGRAVGVAGPVQLALYLAANLMLVALGFYLMGMTRSLAFAERAGQGLWQRIQPFTVRFLPVRGAGQALPLGMLWGWLPCGLVYSVLIVAMTTESAWRGGATMLAFGLGTLPNLLLAGLLLARFRRFAQHKVVRIGAGLLVLSFGLLGLARLGGIIRNL